MITIFSWKRLKRHHRLGFYFSDRSIAIPAELLEQIQLPIGSPVSINIDGNNIMITRSAPQYSLDELLAGMPDDPILSSEDQEWLEVSPVGMELW